MPLPNITSYILGTRKPMDYTSSALSAYLAVSQEMRARQQQMMSDLKQGQEQMLAGQQNIRQGQAHEQNMLDAVENRKMRIEDQSFQREQMGWQREMQPLQMEQAQLGIDAARYDLNVAKPMLHQIRRAELESAQFELEAAVSDRLVESQRTKEFRGAVQRFGDIMAGRVPSPDPSVVEGSFGMPGGAINGAPGMQVKGLKAGQMYWNHDMGAPFAVVDGDDGNPVAVAPPGDRSFQTGRPQRFTPIRPISRDQIAAEKLPDIFAGVQAPGDPDVLTAKDRARDANAFLGFAKTAFGDLKVAKATLPSLDSILKSRPEYQIAANDGSLESSYEKSLRHKQRDEQLRWAFPGDDDYQEWTSKNPGLLDSFRNLPDKGVESALSNISSQWKDTVKARGPKGDPLSNASQSDLTLLMRRNAAAVAGQDKVAIEGGQVLPLQSVDQILKARGFTATQLEPIRPTDDKGNVLEPVNTGNVGIPRANENLFKNPFKPSR